MSNLEMVLGIVLILFAIAVVMVILFQEGHERNSSAVTGGVGDTYLSKHRSRSIDTFLERWTKVISVGFFVLVILANMLFYFHVFG